MRALGLTGAGPGRTVRTTRPAKGNPVSARPAPAATPAAARCGPALGGRLHPRADPARGSSLHRLRHGACARRPHRRPGPPARARGTGARPAPWNRRPGARKHRDGGDPWGLVHHSDHGSKSPVHRLHRATRRRGHRSPRPKPWAPPCAGAAAQALGKPPASAGPVLARRPLEGPRRPRSRNRPLGELVQPHPTPPDQRRRPVTRRRRTPPPSKPHHHRHDTRKVILGRPSGTGGAPGATRGGVVSKSATKALRAGIGREEKRGISTILLARPDSIGAFVAD